MLGAAAALVVSVLLGAVEVGAACEVTLVFVLWSVFDAVPVDGVWLVTGGVAFAGAWPAVSVLAGCEAAAPWAACALASGAVVLVGAAALSDDGAADMEDDGEPLLALSHLSETMLTLCMLMLSLLIPLLLPPALEPAVLLACEPETWPVMETVCPTCCFSCEVSPVTLYCLPLAEIT